MQTNNRNLRARKLWWISLGIGIIVWIVCMSAVGVSFFSNISLSTYRLGMFTMGAASVLNPAGQLYLSYGRTRLAIVLMVLGGIAAITALVTLGLVLMEVTG